MFIAYPAIVPITFLYLLLFDKSGMINTPDYNFLIIMTLIVLIGIAVFIFSMLWTPVKISSATDKVIKMKINNNDYLMEFKRLNHAVLIN